MRLVRAVMNCHDMSTASNKSDVITQLRIAKSSEVNLVPRALVPSDQRQETASWDYLFENPVGLAALLTGSKQITAEQFDIFAREIQFKLQVKWLKERQQRLQTTPDLNLSDLFQNYRSSRVIF